MQGNNPEQKPLPTASQQRSPCHSYGNSCGSSGSRRQLRASGEEADPRLQQPSGCGKPCPVSPPSQGSTHTLHTTLPHLHCAAASASTHCHTSTAPSAMHSGLLSSLLTIRRMPRCCLRAASFPGPHHFNLSCLPAQQPADFQHGWNNQHGPWL